MKKYFTKDGKEVELKKPLHVELETEDDVELITTTFVTESLIKYLLDRGMITCKDVAEKKEVPTNVSYYIERLAKRLGRSTDDTVELLKNLISYSPISVFSLLLKQVALELDKNYDGHIADADNLYCIDAATGFVRPYKKDIRFCPNNITLFRNEKDAYFAIKVLKYYYDRCFY